MLMSRKEIREIADRVPRTGSILVYDSVIRALQIAFDQHIDPLRRELSLREKEIRHLREFMGPSCCKSGLECSLFTYNIELQRRVFELNAEHKLYQCWKNMKSRCSRPNHTSYQSYGGRGIKVCAKWSNSYKAFERWALDNGYDDNLNLDRIDNNKGYGPNNCQWLTKSENTIKAHRNLGHNIKRVA